MIQQNGPTQRILIQRDSWMRMDSSIKILLVAWWFSHWENVGVLERSYPRCSYFSLPPYWCISAILLLIQTRTLKWTLPMGWPLNLSHLPWMLRLEILWICSIRLSKDCKQRKQPMKISCQQMPKQQILHLKIIPLSFQTSISYSLFWWSFWKIADITSYKSRKENCTRYNSALFLNLEWEPGERFNIINDKTYAFWK